MRRHWWYAQHANHDVSIHAPWEGCDTRHSILILREQSFNSRTLGRVRLDLTRTAYHFVEFQFTHPGKGATSMALISQTLTSVSIHAPWEGCDLVLVSLVLLMLLCFNSRTLGRVRQTQELLNRKHSTFQFTHPGKGATPLWYGITLGLHSFNSRTLGRVRPLSHCGV